jgi:hypothetical protein
MPYLPPATRRECRALARPCPRLLCRYHLWPEVKSDTDLPAESCVLDIADDGALTLQEVGDLLGVTRERIRQIQAKARHRLIHYSSHLLDIDLAEQLASYMITRD